MPGWFEFLACAEQVHHVADVVNLAIGVNLLFPVASSFLKCFLDGLEIEPEKIAEKYLDNQSATSGDLEEIAVAAQAVVIERTKGCPLAWGWWVADLLTAGLGIFLLLSGWVDRIGLWCLLLFLPACIAISRSILKYRKLRSDFLGVVEEVKNRASARKKCGTPYVKEYVKKCENAIKRNQGGKKKSAGKS